MAQVKGDVSPGSLVNYNNGGQPQKQVDKVTKAVLADARSAERAVNYRYSSQQPKGNVRNKKLREFGTGAMSPQASRTPTPTTADDSEALSVR